MALACEAGRVADGGTIRCGYHGWEYGLDGALLRVPQRAAQFPDLDPGDWGLVPVAGSAPGPASCSSAPTPVEPFEAWLGDVARGLRPWDHTRPGRGSPASGCRWACNWKLYVENHVDVLHLWYLHGESLGMYDHTGFRPRAHRPPLGERGAAAARRGAVARPAPISHLPEAERDVLRANLLFPNVPTSSSGTLTMTYQVIPEATDRSVLDIRVRAEPGAEMSDEGAAAVLRVFHDEDGFAVEQVQRALASPRFRVGPLAREHEAPITAFQRAVLDFVGGPA